MPKVLERRQGYPGKYTVTVRGPVPDDIRDKLAAAQAEAVKARKRRKGKAAH